MLTSAGVADRRAAHAAAVNLLHHRAGEHLHSAAAYLLRQRRNLGPAVHDRCQRYARRHQVRRRAPAAVAGGENDAALPGRRRMAGGIGLRRGGQHHAGAIIVGEGDRPLGRAAGEEGMARDDFPQPLLRLAW